MNIPFHYLHGLVSQKLWKIKVDHSDSFVCLDMLNMIAKIRRFATKFVKDLALFQFSEMTIKFKTGSDKSVSVTGIGIN